MDQLNYFQKYTSKSEIERKVNLSVWSYTRVSSKEQYEQNASVERQQEANRKDALKRGLTITEEFGGTYESAKSDFTRKEFTRLIEKVKKSKNKPYAILVFKMSRFSRSGGNAIGLVSYLVDELKVNLIEVSTGLDTTTERGKASIWESLFHAYKENLERKEIIVPNMIAFVKNGGWFSKAPRGWDHYGPRVADERFLSKKQKIVINQEGNVLREAWGWKISGSYSDVQIQQKLLARGVQMTTQKISAMWRNPFYCGINTNKLAGEPVKGNWEPMVSVEDFMKVQDILKKNPSGFQHKKDIDDRPLTRLLKCNDCGNYMVGYINQKKQLHYYRCLKCNGVTLSAKPTPKGRSKSAETLFLELLDSYKINTIIKPLLKLQLTKLFNEYNKSYLEDEKKLESEYQQIQSQFKQLKIRLGLGEIDRETYEITFDHLNEKLILINKERNNGNQNLSNLDMLLDKSLERLENIKEMWVSGKLEEKRTLHKSLFPEGIYFDAKNHQYLTRKVNSFVELVSRMSMGYEDKKEGLPKKMIGKSFPVARMGLEPMASGL